jgi:hypothetical protein
MRQALLQTLPLMGQWPKGVGSRSILTGRTEKVEGRKCARGIVEGQVVRSSHKIASASPRRVRHPSILAARPLTNFADKGGRKGLWLDPSLQGGKE